jgi:hypothetical protein
VFLLLVAVMLDMELAGLIGVMLGMQPVAMGHVGVVRARHVIVVLVVFGGLAMMFGGHLVVFGGLQVMLGDLRLAHGRVLRVADRLSADSE